jgi:ferredoxin
MTKVRFISADGEQVREVDAPAGERLLDVAQAHGQPLEGTCDGQMACSTCHVIVDAADFPKLPPACEEEDDMLDLASNITPHSRLACQIWLSDEFATLTVRMPGAARNMLGR